MKARTKPKPVPAKRALKPSQIEALYSIPPSTLHFYCTKLEPATDRLPSFMLPGRGKRRDTRLVYVHELEAWLEKHRSRTTAA